MLPVSLSNWSDTWLGAHGQAGPPNFDVSHITLTISNYLEVLVWKFDAAEFNFARVKESQGNGRWDPS